MALRQPLEAQELQRLLLVVQAAGRPDDAELVGGGALQRAVATLNQSADTAVEVKEGCLELIAQLSRRARQREDEHALRVRPCCDCLAVTTALCCCDAPHSLTRARCTMLRA